MKKNIYFDKIKELVEASTIHGIPSALRTKKLPVKIFWVFVFLLSFSYSMLQVGMMVISYFQFNVIVKMDIVQSENLEFPAVTFCNINPYDYSIEENYSKIKKLLNESFLDQNSSLKSCNGRTKSLLRYSDTEGFSLTKMLISCQYDRKPCNIINFYSQEKSYFGKCYTFNFGKDSEENSIPIEKVKQPGMLNGLQMELFVGAQEYQPCWEKKYGAIVVVHNQTSLPMYLEEGVFVPTGSETNIALSKTVIQKLSKPYSNCVKNATDRTLFDSVYFRNTIDSGGSYSQNWCIRNCSIENILQENRINCDKLNISLYSERQICLNNFENITKNYDFCSRQCPVECESSFFNLVKSKANFPSYRYNLKLLSDESFRSKFPYQDISAEQVKDSILSFNVYFSRNTIEIIQEKPEMNFGTLLGNLGGQLGLFLGISILTFAEIFEILFEMAFIFFGNQLKKKTKIQTFSNNEV